ncbi:hypothetical protein K1719_024108 [Acacia pycnantha]|nr:hypothetical protein K1719_024108 [Acacia pycnantha]
MGEDPIAKEEPPLLPEERLRSTKKVRIRPTGGEEGGWSEPTADHVLMKDKEATGGVSYLNKSLNLDLEGFDNHGVEDVIVTDADFHITRGVGDIPSIEFSKEVREVLAKGMERTLIIKLLGRSITYGELLNRTWAIWQVKGSYQLVDMGGGFYFATFELDEDYNKAMKGQPLVPWIRVDGATYGVEYEGLPTICFECGKYGHTKEKCPSGKIPTDLTATQARENDSTGSSVVQQVASGQGPALELSPEKVSTPYGAWMQVRYPKKGNKHQWGKDAKIGGSHVKGGSRYNVLFDYKDMEANLVPPVKEVSVGVNIGEDGKEQWGQMR